MESPLTGFVPIVSWLIAARSLGHGRRMEGYLTLAKGVGALIFIVAPSSAENATSTAAFFWLGYDRFVFLPFLAAFILSAYGLLGNIHAWPRSRPARIIGAAIGFYIWFVLTGKLVVADAVGSLGFILGMPAMFYGELGVIFSAGANLPPPGAPGNVGAIGH